MECDHPSPRRLADPGTFPMPAICGCCHRLVWRNGPGWPWADCSPLRQPAYSAARMRHSYFIVDLLDDSYVPVNSDLKGQFYRPRRSTPAGRSKDLVDLFRSQLKHMGQSLPHSAGSDD